jgi:hypothetical protein
MCIVSFPVLQQLGPSFDPRNKSEGREAQDEGGGRGESFSNPVVSLSNHENVRVR